MRIHLVCTKCGRSQRQSPLKLGCMIMDCGISGWDLLPRQIQSNANGIFVCVLFSLPFLLDGKTFCHLLLVPLLLLFLRALLFVCVFICFYFVF